ncbi:MAG: DUF5687 family protein [Prevotella sp.]|nr:DUF5687 family protein [Prevotella sp.]
MNRLTLYRTLRQHVKLSEKRSPVYEQNRTAKILIYILSGFMIAYMMFLSVMMSIIANSTTENTPYEFLFGLLPFFLVADFLMRFLGQQTPAQLIKPYLLLPIPRHACVESFILSAMVTPNNLLWLFITVPYAFLTLLFSSGFFVALGFVLGFQLLIIINSQNYMLWRTLILKSMLWWIAPIVLYGLLFLPWLIHNFNTFFNNYGTLGEHLSFWHPLAWLALILLLIAFFFINREVQYRFTISETSADDAHATLKNVSQFSFFDRYGEVGQYIKLEIKSILRNKNMRNSFLFSTVFTIILSLIISYTDIYDDAFSSKFFIVYVFILNGGMLLIKIMGAEGNYIDGLMIHRENILQLLHAKYLFYCALLLLPFLIMLPTVFMGKYTLLMLFALMFFAAGPIFMLLMQLAVYNKQTIPLNSKLVSKGNVETNWFAFFAEMVAMFVPVALIAILSLFLSETVTYTILLVVGIIVVALRKLWLRNIYNRFMARRYQNMESFRATR